MSRGWLHLASGASVGRFVGLAGNLLLSRWLGPIELGLFSLVTTTVQTSDTLVRCGGDYALNFELGGDPEAIQTESGAQLARGLTQICTLTTLLICFGVALWILLGQGLFPLSLTTNQRFILGGLLLFMIACEGSSASAWEMLLVSHRTASLSLKQGIFFPSRLLLAAAGALLGGVLGAMIGWSFVALLQCFFLRRNLGNLWNPFQIWPPLASSVHQLLRRGIPFYISNLLASLIFYPLLLKVASTSGLSEVGYLRVGQILQQVFAFLPATLVPVLFLKLRSERNFIEQVHAIEKPFRVIWFFLLEVLLLYFAFDRYFINLLFGADFLSALLPTRLLLLTALFESLAQLVVQPLLAAGKLRFYGFWQNGSAVMAAVLGWFWIPTAGLAAFLVVRLFYVVVPLIAFGIPIIQQLKEPKKITYLAFLSFILSALTFVQMFNSLSFLWMNYASGVVFVIVLLLNYENIQYVGKLLWRST